MKSPSKQAKLHRTTMLKLTFPPRPVGPSAILAGALCIATIITLAFKSHLLAIAIGVVLAGWLAYVRFMPAGNPPHEDRYARPACLGILILTIVVFIRALGQIYDTGLAVLMIAGLAGGMAVFYGPKIDRFFLKRPIVLWLLLIAGSVTFSLCVYGSLLKAQWYPIDDHEIMSFLGPAGKVSLTDIPRVLMTTEVGSPGGDTPRYRPAYYFLRILETSLWGDSIAGWHAAHLAMLMLSLTLYWRFFMRWIGLLPAAFLILFLMTYFFWSDIFNRLGPSEIYCVVGTGIFLEAYYAIWRRIHNPLPTASRPGLLIVWWLILTFGALVTIGSKENFLPMILPMWVLAVLAVRRRNYRQHLCDSQIKRPAWGSIMTALACTLLASAYTAFITIAVALAIKHRGADFYQREVTTSSRMGLLWSGIQKALVPIAWWDVLPAVLLVALCLILLFKGPRRRIFGRLSWKTILAVSGLGAIYAMQNVFYFGEYPTQIRYDFPGLPAKVLLAIVAVLFILGLLKKTGLNKSIARSLHAGLAGGLLVLTIHAGYKPIIENASLYTLATQYWTTALDKSIQTVKSDPSRPIVITPYDILSDFEPIFSVQRFMSAKGVTNPMYLSLGLVTATDSDRQSQDLLRQLKDVSQAGGKGFQPIGSLPGKLPPGTKPFGIAMSGYVNVNSYSDAGILWPILQPK
jgi:hypothetical protein